MTKQTERSIGFILLGVGFLLTLAWLIFLTTSTITKIEDFKTISLPTTQTVTLAKGHYVIYYQSNESLKTAPELSVSILNLRHNTPLVISSYSGSLTYSLGQKHGIAWATVDIPAKGLYQVRSISTPGQDSKLVIGPSLIGLFGKAIGESILGILVLFFGVGGAGVAFLTLSDRKR